MRVDQSQRGFTLIEVLVAIIIFGAGLLGLARLQALSQENSHKAYLRSQAVFQTQDIADRMRANPQGVENGDYNNISASAPGSAPTPNCLTATSGCTPTELAAFDIWEWQTMNTQLLPMGLGSVNFNNASQTFNINVMWDDNKDGVRDLTNPDPALRDADFSLEFRP